MRLLVLQYAGDYREAVQRLTAGGPETYYAQKYSVNAVAAIAQQAEEVAVLCCMTPHPYNEILSNGVRAIGGRFNGRIQAKTVIQMIEEFNPSHLIVQTPLSEVFNWAIKKKIKTLAIFAESIQSRGLRSRFRHYQLANLLNHQQIEWIGGYGIRASQTLEKIGVKPDKIVPRDFIIDEAPGYFEPKTLQDHGIPWRLFYIGSLIKPKGIGDVLQAVAQLKSKGFSVTLSIAGKDEGNVFQQQTGQLQIEDCVEFLGLVPNKDVISLMRESDVVLVPSHHSYPEGFPLTIIHALCARTPLIVSDHPMFRSSLKSGENAIFFSAGNPTSLVGTIEKLFTDPELYHHLSTSAYKAWEDLRVPVKWADIIYAWLNSTPQDKQWLFNHRLNSGRYQLNAI
jgi:glycosyltransferase involved in cell wall biosynthesis